MREDSLDFLCCPACHSDLTLDVERTVDNEVISGSLKCGACSKRYKIEDGIPDFLLPEFLNEKDKKWMLEYDRMFRSYDILMCFVIPVFSVGIAPLERHMWTKRLQIKKGAHVLDVSTGTGQNWPFLVRQTGSTGRIAAMDVSKGMLTYAKVKAKRKKRKNIELQRANASYLPYKNDTFDAVMHVGGINTFGEKRRALHEMVRVARSNAKIVIVDEGLAPGKENSFIGKFLLKTNALYACKPATKLLPKGIKNLQLAWKFDPFWPHYVMDFQKSQ